MDGDVFSRYAANW